MSAATLRPDLYPVDGVSLYEGHDLVPPIHIWAVGASPQEAIASLAAARWSGSTETLRMGEALDDSEGYDWAYLFTSDGTSFKAAGINVPGGVVLTWWS